MGMKEDKSKFVFSETFNNKDGKTSGSGFIGVICGMIAAAAFIAGVVGWYLEKTFIIEYFDKVIQFGGLSALLLGVRKASEIFTKENPPIPTYKEERKDENSGSMGAVGKIEGVIEKVLTTPKTSETPA